MFKTVASLVYAFAALVGLTGLGILAVAFAIRAVMLGLAGDYSNAGAYVFAAVGAAHVTTLLVDSAHKVAIEYLNKSGDE